VGHHAEKRHPRNLKRIDEHFAKAKEHHDKAAYFRRRAAAAESNVIIFSDDPDATEKLIDKIERLKKRQGVMKRANQLIRKADREASPTLASLRKQSPNFCARLRRQSWLSQLRPREQFGQHPPT